MPSQISRSLKPLCDWNIDYILSLPRGEFDWLEFKRSAWLTLASDCLEKLSCYISAWANYDGGYLIIGVKDPNASEHVEADERLKLLRCPHSLAATLAALPSMLGTLYPWGRRVAHLVHSIPVRSIKGLSQT